MDRIDWRKENIKITALGFNGTSGECFWPRVPAGTHICIHYPDPDNPACGVQPVQDYVFPNVVVPINWLGASIVFNPPRDLLNANILNL